jgi:hypothetical protein
MRTRHVIIGIAVLAAIALAGCSSTKKEAMETSSDSLVASNPQEQTPGSITPQSNVQPPPAQPQAAAPVAPAPTHHTTHHRTSTASNPAPAVSHGVTVPSGTSVAVSVNTKISSETAQAGDTWVGVVKDPVVVDGRTVIPAGSTVTGTVTAAKPAQKGDRAMLDLGISSINVNGTTYHVSGGTEEIVAGSTRARNLGAIAGGAAAGALIGRAVGGSGKGALIGGLLGGAAAGGGVAASKGYQVVVKEGTDITFTTHESVTLPS